MQNPGYIALSRQVVLANQLDVTANNIANVNTTGFKRQNSLFSEHLSKMDNGESVSYVLDAGTVRDLGQGPLRTTGSSLDIAIEGDGYFSFETPAGTRFGRDGRFSKNGENELVNRNGYPVLTGDGERITLTETAREFTFSKTGEVFADNALVGKIQLVNFRNPQALVHTSQGLYKADGAPQDAEEGVTLRQGMLEGSNVNPIVELVRMLEIQRDYQGSHRIMKTEHDRLTQAIKELGRVELG